MGSKCSCFAFVGSGRSAKALYKAPVGDLWKANVCHDAVDRHAALTLQSALETDSLNDALQQFPPGDACKAEAALDATPSASPFLKPTTQCNAFRVRTMSDDEAATEIQACSQGVRVRRKKAEEDREAEVRFIVKWWLESALSIMNNQTDVVSRRREQVDGIRRELACGSIASSTQRLQDVAALKIQAIIRGRQCRKKAAEAQAQTKADVCADALCGKAQAGCTATQNLQGVPRPVITGRRELTKVRDDSFVADLIELEDLWASVFNMNCLNGQRGLNCEQFNRAIGTVHPRLSQPQVLRLWKGFGYRAEAKTLDWFAFHAICEAVEIGDDCAAHLAFVDVDTFKLLGVNGVELAATRLQAVQRGRLVRKRIACDKAREQLSTNAFGAERVSEIREEQEGLNIVMAEKEPETQRIDVLMTALAGKCGLEYRPCVYDQSCGLDAQANSRLASALGRLGRLVISSRTHPTRRIKPRRDAWLTEGAAEFECQGPPEPRIENF